MKANNGFTLLEILIANFLGLLIISLLVTILISLKNSYQLQKGLNTLHENMNLAIYFFAHDFEESGFTGCRSLSTVKNFNSSLTHHIGIIGANNGAILPDKLRHRVLPETDTIIIEKIIDPINYLIDDMQQEKQMIVYAKDSYQSGDKLLINDCETSEILEIKNVINLKDSIFIETTYPLTKRYNKNAIVAHLSAITYFIGRSSHLNSQGKPINSLYRKDLFTSSFNPDELLEGIDNMHIQYIVRQHGQIQYQPANKIENWHDVIGLHVSLLLDTIEPSSTKNYSFVFANEKYEPKDFKLYKPLFFNFRLREK